MWLPFTIKGGASSLHKPAERQEPQSNCDCCCCCIDTGGEHTTALWHSQKITSAAAPAPWPLSVCGRALHKKQHNCNTRNMDMNTVNLRFLTFCCCCSCCCRTSWKELPPLLGPLELVIGGSRVAGYAADELRWSSRCSGKWRRRSWRCSSCECSVQLEKQEVFSRAFQEV